MSSSVPGNTSGHRVNRHNMHSGSHETYPGDTLSEQDDYEGVGFPEDDASHDEPDDYKRLYNSSGTHIRSAPYAETSSRQQNSLDSFSEYGIGGYFGAYIGEILVGRYVIVKKLGIGPYASTYLARDCKLEIFVAIKVYKAAPMYKTIAANECNVLLHLEQTKPESSRETNIVKLLNAFGHQSAAGHHPCLVLEYLGPSLACASMEVEKPPEDFPRVCKNIQVRVLQGLKTLHQANVVHSDIKASKTRISLPTIMMDMLTQRQLSAEKATGSVLLNQHRVLVSRNQKIQEMQGYSMSCTLPGLDLTKITQLIQTQSQSKHHGLNKKERKKLKKKAKKQKKREEQSIFLNLAKFRTSEIRLHTIPAKHLRNRVFSAYFWKAGYRSKSAGGRLQSCDFERISPHILRRSQTITCFEDPFFLNREHSTESVPWPVVSTSISRLYKSIKDDGLSRFKICGFSNATVGPVPSDEVSTKASSYTQSYRSPEIILKSAYTGKTDIWSAGCLFFKCFTGYDLFHPSRGVSELLRKKAAPAGQIPKPVPALIEDFNHLVQMTSFIGKLPVAFRCSTKRWKKFFTKSGEFLVRVKSRSIPSEVRLDVKPTNLVEAVEESLSRMQLQKPGVAEAFVNFLKSVLELDPAARPSADRLLKHSWLAEVINSSLHEQEMIGHDDLSDSDISLRSENPSEQLAWYRAKQFYGNVLPSAQYWESPEPSKRDVEPSVSSNRSEDEWFDKLFTGSKDDQSGNLLDLSFHQRLLFGKTHKNSLLDLGLLDTRELYTRIYGYEGPHAL